MGCSNAIGAWADLSNFSFARFVETMLASGWVVDEKVGHLSPDGDDEGDWDSCKAADLPAVLARLDQRRTFMGISIRHAATAAWISPVFDVPANKMWINLNAGCPQDPVWPRVVDPRWALQVLQEVCRKADLRRIADVEFSADSPA